LAIFPDAVLKNDLEDACLLTGHDVLEHLVDLQDNIEAKKELFEGLRN
jgi:hypothetical protein